MAEGDIYLTNEGYEKLRAELEALKIKRYQIIKQIEEARHHGDLSENAEYDAAKEAQGLNEKRIAELEQKLSRARMIDFSEIAEGEARIGTRVCLEDMKTKEQCEYILVSEEEADFSQGKISIASPIGKGLLGHKENEIVDIRVPVGMLRYKIVKIAKM